ncbi:LPXTG cell wall anchor domain-containing protein [Aerococcus urinae]|uniref:collagen-flanked surface repeat-containing protein n=1 Tax=Aerococcus urinae TaxID=1376 RepID=UPI0018E12B2F|nr:LPXTG cell wall anchor domain-containing protein [Aerococcus urinae]
MVEKGQDGVTTIKFYPTDPKTGQADKTKDPVATGEVKDGKSPIVETTRVEDADPTTEGNQPGTKVVVKDPETGKVISESFVKDGEKGQDGAKGEKGDKGEDGKTYAPVVEKGQDGVTTIKFYPVDPKTGKPDTKQDPVATGQVQDGAKGDKGDQGEKGQDGVDGKTYAPVVTKGADGTTTIKFYPVDPKTGKADESQPAVAEGSVKDGKDAKAPVVETERVEDLDPNTPGNQAGTKITVKDPENGKVISETFVKDGQDVKSPEVTTKDNGNGTHTITIKNPDGTTTTTTVKDGAKGEKGDKGQDGTNGVDGKAYAPVVEKGQDGTTTIKFYPVDPKTGKADTTKPAVAEGAVKDGANGKSAYTTVVEGPNAAGEPGRWIINYFDKNNDGKFTDDEVVSAQFVRDGKDGQSPTVEVKDNGDGTHTITTKNPDGTVNSTTTVKNGKDGKSPVVESTRVEDADPNTPGNQAGTKITVKDPETGKVISESFVKDGLNGKDGKDGKNGIDGKSFAPVVVKGADGTTTIKFYPVDPKTGQPDTTQAPVAEGSVKDGKDGKSPEVTTKDNGDGTHTITIKNPDGTTTTTTVKDGKDGKTPEVGVKDNGDGSHTITIKNPDGTTTTTTVRDGKNGQNGKDGRDGIDGKSFAPVVEKGQDSTTTIKFYPVDPKTGQPDTTQAPVAEGSVKDGKDGKSPEVSLKDNGDGTHTITVKNPDGTTSTTTVKNGKDGKSPEVTTTDNGDGTHTITIKNPDGTTTTTTVKDGKDGRDGIDGKTFAPVVEKGQDGTTTIKFYPVDPKTDKPDTSQPAVAEGSVKDGRDGKDGKDGKSPQVSIRNNNDGSHTITIKNPDGTTTTTTVKDGKDGRDGKDGKDGKDGLSPKVETRRNDANDGVIIKVTPQVRDGEGNVIDGTPSETEVKDGQDGKTFTPVVEKGQDGVTTIKFYPTGKDGQAYKTQDPAACGEVKDGADGKTFTPVGEKGQDGVTTIKFYPTDPKTGQADKTKDPVATGEVKDGKSPIVETTRVEDADPTTEGNQPGTKVVVKDPETGKVISESFVKDGEKGQDGAKGEKGDKGEDGKTYAPVVEKGQDGVTTIKFYPVDPKTGKPDTKQDPVATGQVQDGAKGDKGDQGEKGQDGVDGKTYAPVVTKGADGTTTIKFYPVDPKTGKADESQPAVAEGSVKDGKDAKAPVVETERVEDLDPNTPGNQAGTKITVKDPENGKVISETFVKDGQDVKSPEVTTKDNGNGTHTITIKNPDGTTTTTTVKDGAKGEKGDKGQDGTNGVDGKAYAPVVEKGQDGTTTIKFYPVDPKTGKADTTKPAVAEGAVKDGANGKSAYTTVVEGPNAAGEPGRWIINYFDKNNDGKFTDDEVVSAQFVRDGKDGQSPTVEVKDNGDGTHTITTKNPDGTVNSTTTVKNGKDGKSPVVESTRVEDADPNTPGNQAGTKITVKDPETGKVISESFVKDGLNGKDGKDGKNGIDGKSFAPVVVKGADGTTTIKFYPVDPKTGQPDTTQAPVAEGSVKDGKDGKSPEVTTKDNGDGTHTITIKNPDGTTTTTTVKDGKDGKTPEVGVKDNGDGSHTITIKNPDGTTTTTTVRDGKNGQNGKDGRDGIDGKSFAPVVEKGQDSTTTIKFYPVDPKTGQPDTTQAPVAEGSVKDGKDGKSPEVSLKDNGDGTHTITVKNPDGTTSTTTVKNGKDGKSPEVTTTDNGDGTHTITIKNPDGTTTTTTVKDGKDGRDGIDGKTFAPVVEKGQDGPPTIKFYPVDPKTDKPDTSQPAVAEGSVKDGRDGKDGKDGKSPQVSIRNNNDGSHTITIKNPDGTTTTTTVKDGKDGRDGKDGKDGKDGHSQRIRTEKGKDSQGNEGIWVIITDDKGNELSREFIRDGKTPSVKVEEGKNSRGESGQWIIVFDGDGNEVSREFVRDGKDGASSSLETVPGKNEKGESGLWVIVKDGEGKESSRHFVRDGKDGKDGKDGRSVQKIYNRQGKLIIIFSDHTTEEIEIPCCKPCPETPRTPKPEDPTPEVPNKPETPKPGEPKVPENPSPEVPNVPGKPEEPGKPEQPEVPEPGQPKVPGDPTPEVPNVPGEPTPEVPNVPGEPTPEVPNVPGEPTPEVPNVPGEPTPEVPNVPGNPTPEVPNVPGNPTPEVPNVSGNPTPEIPNQPSDPAPQVPGQADPDNSFKNEGNESVTNKEQNGQAKQASLPATGAEVTSAMTVIIASLLLSSGSLLVKNNKED